jgi:hypothetical protein
VLQFPVEVGVAGHVVPVIISIKVFDVVSGVVEEVSVTVIFTDVVAAGTTNLYHTSGLVPQFPPPDVVVEVELYSVPAIGEQSGLTVRVVALLQRSFAGV